MKKKPMRYTIALLLALAAIMVVGLSAYGITEMVLSNQLNMTGMVTQPSSSGGGGGGSPPEPRLTTSPDGAASLSIPLSTTIKDKDGRRIYPVNIKVNDNPNPPAPPIDQNIIGMPYSFEPSGATFDPPITLTFTFDPDNIPEGVAEGDLVVAFYNEGTGEWVTLECVVDTETNTITAQVAHFTAFAILAPLPAVEESVIEEEPVAEPPQEPEEVATSPEPEEVTAEEPPSTIEPIIPPEQEAETPLVTPTPEPSDGVPAWVWALVAVVVIGGTIIGIAYWAKRKRD